MLHAPSQRRDLRSWLALLFSFLALNLSATAARAARAEVDRIYPTRVAHGQPITIEGRGFQRSSSFSLVSLSTGVEHPLRVESFHRRQIIACFDLRADRYALRIRSRSGRLTRGPELSVEAPTAHTIAPHEAMVGCPITISGEYFGASPGSVLLEALTGGALIPCRVQSWSASTLLLTIPEVPFGEYRVYVENPAGRGASSNLRIHSRPPCTDALLWQDLGGVSYFSDPGTGFISTDCYSSYRIQGNFHRTPFPNHRITISFTCDLRQARFPVNVASGPGEASVIYEQESAVWIGMSGDPGFSVVLLGVVGDDLQGTASGILLPLGWGPSPNPHPIQLSGLRFEACVGTLR
ncbi:MAG: hypothetical protein IPN34_15725 [Planctomycetes bacterium]|nr:hypothetical protein [Planctomycetota bacterium]